MAALQPVSVRKFEKFLLFAGCRFVRQKGSHRVFHRTGLVRPIIVPAHSGDLPLFVVRNILKQLGISTDDYLQMMSRM